MKSNWQELSIEDIKDPSDYSIAMGPFGSNIKTDNFVSQGVPVIRGMNLTSGRFNDNDFVYLTERKADDLKSANAFPGDIVFTHRGTLGQVGIIPENSRYPRYVVSQSQMKLRVNPTIASPLYIYYYFKSPLGQYSLLANTSTTGVPAISSPLTTLRTIKIVLPPLPEQRAIAEVLGALDDKIELNRRMNRTLEEIAQAIFKEWFVDNPEAEGWETRTLGETYYLTMGQSPPGETYNQEGEGLPFFQGRADFGFRYPTNRVYCTAPTRFAEKGDTLVSVRAPVGDMNMAATKCAIGRGVAAVCHNSGSRSFTYYSLNYLKPVFLRFEAEGTVFGSINKNDFQNLILTSPPIDLIQRFDKICSPIDQKIECNETESTLLSQLRDSLLPKLMRGEIRVKDLA